MRFLCLVELLTCLQVTIVTGYTTSQADILYSGLTSGYITNSRPASIVTVEVAFIINSVNFMDVTSRTFSVSGVFTVTWNDTRFLWDSTNFGNTAAIYLTTTQAWHPNLVLDNALTTNLLFSDDDLMFTIQSTGVVTAVTSGGFVTLCDVNTQYYPFDTHTCSLNVRSLTYDTTVVTLQHGSTSVTQANFVENNDWKFMTSHLSTSDVTLSKLTYTTLSFNVKISRQTSGIVTLLLIPLILVAMLGLLTFLIPPASESKIIFSAVRLLAEIGLLTPVYDVIPNVTNNTSVLGVFLTFLLLFSLLEIFMAVLIVRAHLNKLKDAPVSKTVNNAATILARLTSWSAAKPDSKPGLSAPETSNTPEPKVTLHRKPSIVSPDSRHKRRNDGILNSSIDTIAWQHNQEERKRLCRIYEWVEIADMIDRLCLVLFLVLRLIVIIVLMTVLSAAGSDS